jgi:hypothetical protein
MTIRSKAAGRIALNAPSIANDAIEGRDKIGGAVGVTADAEPSQ